MIWDNASAHRGESGREYVGMVETGESRTPRPKGPLARYATSLSGDLMFTPGGLRRHNLPGASRLSL